MSCPASSVFFTTLSMCVSIGPIIPTSYHDDYYYSMFLPTDSAITAEYASKSASFLSQDFSIPIILLTKWVSSVGTALEYTNFETSSNNRGSCAVLKPNGLWSIVDCSLNYPILIISRPLSGLPNTCMAEGLPFYRFNCPGTVHWYSLDKNFEKGYCSPEQFCYTGSNEYSKDCRALNSTDAFTRKTKEYALLLELVYVTRNGLGTFITDEPLPTDTAVKHMGYCSPGPCVYGSTFALHWVQAHVDGQHVDNLYTASRDEALYLNTKSDFMEGRYVGGYKGIVCYIWTNKPSFNCSFCYDDTAVIVPEVDTFSWYPLLMVSFALAYFISGLFYKNSNLVLFVLCFISLVGHSDASLIDDLTNILLPKPKTTLVQTFPTVPVGSSSTLMQSSIPLTTHILRTSSKSQDISSSVTTKEVVSTTSVPTSVSTKPGFVSTVTSAIPPTSTHKEVVSTTSVRTSVSTKPGFVSTVTSAIPPTSTQSSDNVTASTTTTTTPSACHLCDRDAGTDIVNILIFMLVITIFSRNGVFLVMLLIPCVSSCNVTEVAISDLCWVGSDASLSPSTNIEIPLSASRNQKLVADLQMVSSASIYPYLSCVFLPVVSCSAGYCDMYGNQLTYLPLSPKYSAGDYLAIVIDKSLQGVNVGEWISISSGTYCTNFRTRFGASSLTAAEIGFLLLLVLIYYFYAAYH